LGARRRHPPSLHPGVRPGRRAGGAPRRPGPGALAPPARQRAEGSACRLLDPTRADGVHVLVGCWVQEAEVGAGAIVGPFARLRPGTRLGERVHIGNFVETKKAVLGAGTKANHLTYLGDCEIGADSNVGAGTITCNYDGFEKHFTRIGARVFIGSDTQFVAPVTVADDVYVASGTTVKTDGAAGAPAPRRPP